MEKVNYLGREDISCNFSFGRDPTCGFSWPQRNYRCSFCRKEFKSAQALGGHMNVHRRDRAKLRLSPSWESHIPNPNPNFSSSSSPAARYLPYMTTYRTYLTPSLASTDEAKVPLFSKNTGDFLEVGEFEGFTQENESSVRKESEFVGLDLDLEMGLFKDAKEDLDLELRLGYS